VEVRAILSVAKGLSWVEFVVLGCEAGVLVEVWVQAVFLCGGFAHYLAWLSVSQAVGSGVSL